MSSSSRRTAIRLICLAALAGSLSLTATARPPHGEARETAASPPVLVIRSDLAQRGRAQSNDDRAAAILMAAMPPTELAALAGALDDLWRRLAIRANPLVEDLEDDSPEAPLRGWLSQHVAALSAASALAQPTWEAGDRDIAVSVARSCAGALELVSSHAVRARCVPLWGIGDPAEERARFVAWPVARAIVLRAPAPDDAARGAEELRASSTESSRMALILLERDAVRGDRMEESRVRAAARAVAARLRGDVPGDAAAILAFARDRPGGRLFADLDLSPRDVLVVPRLSSLAERTAFEREVDGRRAALAPTRPWIVRRQ
jgi:hypothetical protein